MNIDLAAAIFGGIGLAAIAVIIAWIVSYPVALRERGKYDKYRGSPDSSNEKLEALRARALVNLIWTATALAMIWLGLFTESIVPTAKFLKVATIVAVVWFFLIPVWELWINTQTIRRLQSRKRKSAHHAASPAG